MRIHPFLPLLVVSPLGSACVGRVRSEIVYVQTAAPPARPWVVEPIAQPAPPRAGSYVLVGYDNASDGPRGDTTTQAVLPMLCLRESRLPDPGGLTPPSETPGGALRRRWSGAEIALTEPMAGHLLASGEVADGHCSRRFGAGWRMAEFHDGGPNAGFDFWAFAVAGSFDTSRFWVAISDQPANPWDSGRAMTWRLLARR